MATLLVLRQSDHAEYDRLQTTSSGPQERAAMLYKTTSSP